MNPNLGQNIGLISAGVMMLILTPKLIALDDWMHKAPYQAYRKKHGLPPTEANEPEAFRRFIDGVRRVILFSFGVLLIVTGVMIQ